MKKEMTIEEAMALAQRLDLNTYISTAGLIDSLHIEENKELNVCVIATDKHTAEYLIKKLTGEDILLGYDTMLRAEIRHGEPSYEVITEYGELTIDLGQFIEVVTRKDTICHVYSENKALKNLRVTFVYSPDYNSIDEDTWRCILLEADKTVMMLNAPQILPRTELKFVESQLLPVYSARRLSFGLGNSQYVKAAEWKEGAARVHRLVGEEFMVFQVFTETVPEETRAHYDGSEETLENILEQTGKHILETRQEHIEDLESYKAKVMEGGLIALRQKLERYKAAGSETVEKAERDIDKLNQSREHIEKYISLFLQTPLVSLYRNDVEKFAERLTDSLKEDIMQSADIKQDAKALPRYLSYVWERFTEDLNIELERLFEKETATIIDMMNLDLKKIARDMGQIDLNADLKNHLDGSFSVHTFFARKTTAGNGLTEAMTIVGLITTIFISPIGLGAIVGSELIKVFGKEKFDREYKEELAKKIADVVESNVREFISQANVAFEKVNEAYRTEILSYYDETIGHVKSLLTKEKETVTNVSSTIDYIDSLLK